MDARSSVRGNAEKAHRAAAETQDGAATPPRV